MINIRAGTVAIIGAGPSGLVAAKYFCAETAFDQIVVYEQRSSSGGIWNYTPDDRDEDLFTIPRTKPFMNNQTPVWREIDSSGLNGHHVNGENGAKKVASFLSPIYEKLETNIPRGLMGFQDLDWPQDSQLFPRHGTVLEYIQEYGKDVQDLIQYETQVANVTAADDTPTGGWTVTSRNLHSPNEYHDSHFDAVVVANGHFIVPYIPDIPFIKEWGHRYPGTITHSKYFRRAEDFAGKKVVVVGNSASGIDISSQIAAVCAQPLLWSSKSVSMFKPAQDPRKRDLPPIESLIPAIRGVSFEGGTIEHDVDAIVFATGYFYSLPFLRNVKPALIGDGSHVENTYQHLFYAPRPTLSLLALNQRVIPFPIAEAQSSVLARVYAGRLSLPPYTEMKKWEEETLAGTKVPKDFHLLPFPKDGNYINQLSNWALSAERTGGLANDGKGKLPPIWGDWEFWCRENFPAIRAAFGARGEGRREIRSLEELGFVYEEYSKKQKGEEGKLI
ncbi:flavin dependent monooxygenase-like protein [Lophiotrema nucula]|uniref:Flavin dependent monooxygenase-like protein n=1 Tax=Lophiotrema nucula TaxID=690887 RepID=A0A6A5YVX5_9PLEO|nr:flavin dependent monooxygenase-like protein [Lophiotrema nucula]